MKRVYFKIMLIVFVAGAINACTNKKLENNIKSLERRVAALENRAGIKPAVSPTAEPGASENKGPFAAMTFEKTEYDFGTIKEGDVVDHTYFFTNTGKAPLVISKATATCGCTVPSWPKKPVAVGAKGEIKVKFNSKNKKNLQTKYISISANTKPEMTRLKLTGNVIPAEDSK